MRHKHRRPQTTLFLTCFYPYRNFRILEPASPRLYTTVDCIQYKKPYNNKKIEGYCFGRERRHGRTDEAVRVRAGDRAGRRLVTRVRSGWGRASPSMRTKYHICQPFAVEFGRVSVNTGALLGEASRDARLFAGSKTIPEWCNV